MGMYCTVGSADGNTIVPHYTHWLRVVLLRISIKPSCWKKIFSWPLLSSNLSPSVDEKIMLYLRMRETWLSNPHPLFRETARQGRSSKCMVAGELQGVYSIQLRYEMYLLERMKEENRTPTPRTPPLNIRPFHLKC